MGSSTKTKEINKTVVRKEHKHQQRIDPSSLSKTTTTTTMDTISPKIGRRKIPPNEENETPARYINDFPEYEKKFGNGVVMFWCEICHRYTHTHSTGSHVGMSGDEEKKTKKKDHHDDDKKEGKNDKSAVCSSSSITAKSDGSEKPMKKNKKNAKQAKRGRYKKKCERLSRVSSNRRNENKSEQEL